MCVSLFYSYCFNFSYCSSYWCLHVCSSNSRSIQIFCKPKKNFLILKVFYKTQVTKWYSPLGAYFIHTSSDQYVAWERNIQRFLSLDGVWCHISDNTSRKVWDRGSFKKVKYQSTTSTKMLRSLQPKFGNKSSIFLKWVTFLKKRRRRYANPKNYCQDV